MLRNNKDITDIERKSDILANEIEDEVYSVFASLPDELTDRILFKFVDACNEIERIVQGAFDQAEEIGVGDHTSWIRLLVPLYTFAGRWCNAYGKGFTWEKFIEDIYKDGCTKVEKYRGKYSLGINFLNKKGEAEFSICLVHDD